MRKKAKISRENNFISKQSGKVFALWLKFVAEEENLIAENRKSVAKHRNSFAESEKSFASKKEVNNDFRVHPVMFGNSL